MASTLNDLKEQGQETAREARSTARSAMDAVAEKAQEAGNFVKDKAMEAGSFVKDRARGMASNLAESAENVASAAARRAEEAACAVGDRAVSLGQDLTDLIRRNPLPAMLVGIGIGYFLARGIRQWANRD